MVNPSEVAGYPDSPPSCRPHTAGSGNKLIKCNNNNSNSHKNYLEMKAKNQILKWLAMLLLPAACSTEMWAQGPYPNTGNQTVCLNSTEPYGVILTTGSTYTWSIIPGTGGAGTIVPGGTTNLITVNWTNSGTCTLRVVETNANDCTGPGNDILITVRPVNTIGLSSASGTDHQTLCTSTPLTNITYTTTGATGATVTGLPNGVTGTWTANVVTISGTPTLSGTFNYTVTLTGGCGNVTATGQIVVTSVNTITLSSAPGTNNQSVCINTPLTNITYATTGATGATFAGLPSGVTGNWAANVVTLSGTPSASGTFNYTVTLTGGCGNVSASGQIIVHPVNTITLSSAPGTNNQTLCSGTLLTTITYTTTRATGATFAGLPNGVTGNWAANVVTISGTPSLSGTFNYTVTLTGGCGSVNATGSIKVNPLPATSTIYHN